MHSLYLRYIINHKSIKMKKKLFVFAFLISFATFAQTSIRVINLDVKMGRADEVARLFAGVQMQILKENLVQQFYKV